MNFRIFLGVFAATTPSWAAVTAEPTKEQAAFFEEKVRPLLSDNCFQCHSEEQGKSKGGLTMDTKAGLLKGGDGGAEIVPGDPDKSLLYKALTYKDDDLQMPPKSKGGKLPDAQLAIIAEWIKMGAPDPRVDGKKVAKLSGLNDKARQHWAYQPVTKPVVPTNRNQQWCRTPIDSFILQKLEANNMLPSPDASKETLLRRVTFDLTGLPPTAAEVEAFLADPAPNAYEHVVDRLLASPAYGERWGRHWLDTARYSDTIGGERNAARTTEYRYPDAWTYRDYVIKALNDDKPYTDFVTEQLAADKIPGVQPGDPRLAAMGFMTVGERFKNVNDIINDRIDTTSKAFMGLTVACARCHDHMFDPIPTRDYYALHGVFANISEPDDKPLLAPRSNDQQRADFTAKYDAQIKTLRDRYLDAVGFYLGELQRAPAAYIKAAMAGGLGKGRNQEALQERNAIISKNKLDEQYVQYLQRGMQRNPAVWAPLRAFHEGRSYQPKAMAANADMMAERMEEKISKQAGDKAGGLARKFAERMKNGPNKIVDQALAAKQPKNFEEALQVYVDLFAQNSAKAKGFIPALKAATSTTVPGYEDPALFEFLRGPFEVAPASAIDTDWVEDATAGWPNRLLGRARLNFGDINLLETSHPGAPAHAMVVEDKKRVNNSPVFIRGQQETKGAIVQRGFLEILSPGHKPVTFSEGSGRLELAKCITSRDNPITARVAVNRVWMHHFGEGFVRTPDDLGVMSEKPTHPELLDYLSNYFMDNGWSFKKLHKLIVMSRVYAESSHTRPEYETQDPANRLLWRANIRRLDFESTRDSLLVFSGQLDHTVGGKPINLTDEPYSFRRSVYGYVDRGNLPELMGAFDFSDPDMPNSKRTTTVVPQQALFLMNSSMAVDVSRKILARPEVGRTTTDLSRIMSIYRVLFQRSPNPREIALGVEFIQSEARMQTDAVAAVTAKAGPRTGRAKGGGGQNNSKFGAITNEGDRVERKPLTAWETYVQSLLFSNEAAYVN